MLTKEEKLDMVLNHFDRESDVTHAMLLLDDYEGVVAKKQQSVQEHLVWPAGSQFTHISLLNMGKAMAKERSREIGDAWNQLADLLALLSKARTASSPQPVQEQPAPSIGAEGVVADSAQPSRDLQEVIDTAAEKLDAAVRCNPKDVDKLIHEPVPLVGTLANLPPHVRKCIVAYGNARAAVANKQKRG